MSVLSKEWEAAQRGLYRLKPWHNTRHDLESDGTPRVTVNGCILNFLADISIDIDKSQGSQALFFRDQNLSIETE